ncbi:MAG: HD domain-containing protein [Deltaproteobacteria bacterium]|nr:HD domain-containing protein [Deltaproteobacteria bacterium]
MVKFSDLTNGEINSSKLSSEKESDAAQANPRLSFRKLAAEQKEAHPTDKVVSEKKASDKDQIGESGKVLYQKAADYLKQAFEAVKQRKMVSLDQGFQIIREMVEMQSFQDSLFIEALHFDDSLQFMILNNVNVAIYAINMAENLGWSKERQIEIGMAGLLHDIGMAVIPEKLIYKKQKLSEAEFKIFKERSNYSYKILKSLGDDYTYLAECAAQVNERLDGSGYPQGLEGDEIDEYAQIIGLVDMYEALIHSRPQRVKFHHFTAVKEIIKASKHLFQRKHLKALLNIFSIFPLQSCVRLNSNAIGRVIETYPDLPMRPRIQVVFDSQQRRVLTERILNLPDDPLLYIVDSLMMMSCSHSLRALTVKLESMQSGCQKMMLGILP